MPAAKPTKRARAAAAVSRDNTKRRLRAAVPAEADRLLGAPARSSARRDARHAGF